jgi:hypothetical protein
MTAYIMTDADAIKCLQESGDQTQFIKSLLGQYAARQRLTPIQMTWVHKLAAERSQSQSQSRSFVVHVKGHEIVFESDLTDEAAFGLLGRHKPSPFITSLLNTKVLSAKQLAWVHRLACDTLDFLEGAPAAQKKPREEPIELANIVGLFEKASEKLKSPKIALQHFSLVRLDMVVMIKINATDGVYGFIDMRSMALRQVGPVNQTILGELKELNANPAAYVTAYGVMTGNCCFCRHGLQESKSLAMGYGPVCARNYGLPWGKK